MDCDYTAVRSFFPRLTPFAGESPKLIVITERNYKRRGITCNSRKKAQKKGAPPLDRSRYELANEILRSTDTPFFSVNGPPVLYATFLSFKPNINNVYRSMAAGNWDKRRN